MVKNIGIINKKPDDTYKEEFCISHPCCVNVVLLFLRSLYIFVILIKTWEGTLLLENAYENHKGTIVLTSSAFWELFCVSYALRTYQGHTG